VLLLFEPSSIATAAAVAGGGLVFDHQLHFKSGVPEFKLWADAVPSFTYSKTVPYFQVGTLAAHEYQLLLCTVPVSYEMELCLAAASRRSIVSQQFHQAPHLS
jgi:hypothetical protein